MPLDRFGAKKPGVKVPTKNGKATIVEPPPPALKDNRKQQTIRLSPANWRRVKDFALDEDATVQELAVRGISRLMQDRGLPPLED